ncbi:MAG: hypothetical protein U1E72_10970 [Burkholderiaceae bacterium]
MQAPQSTARAAAWMAGWLTLMLVIAIAGREAMRELTVFQLMEMRSLIGLVLLWPLVRAAGGLPALRIGCASMPCATPCTTQRSTPGSRR